MNYSYPGNIRELKSTVELAAVMSTNNIIEPGDITFRNINVNKNFLDREKTLKEYTIDIISFYLEKYDKNVLKVAEKLQIGKSTIYKMASDGEITI
jgi:DNA-binding NtrC family response regulator